MHPWALDKRWIYRCDGLVVDPCAHRLECEGQTRRVEPKVYTVLLTLLEHAGEVVDKEALLTAAWGHRHVTPGVLSHTISQLRQALGDSAAQPRYIATVHTLGYCFVGEVQRQPRPNPLLTELSLAERSARNMDIPAHRFRPRLVVR